jgi:hypothetical protein
MLLRIRSKYVQYAYGQGGIFLMLVQTSFSRELNCGEEDCGQQRIARQRNPGRKTTVARRFPGRTIRDHAACGSGAMGSQKESETQESNRRPVGQTPLGKTHSRTTERGDEEGAREAQTFLICSSKPISNLTVSTGLPLKSKGRLRCKI